MIKIKSFFLILFMTLACAGLAYASEEHEPRWADFGWRVLNLVLFCALLWYFVGNLCKKFFRNRKQTIQDTLDDLEKRKKDARDKLAEIEKRIANLEAEQKAILEESRQQGERLKKSIVDDAHKQAQQIVDQAQRSAENEGRAMMEQVRTTVAAEIIDAAGKALKGKLSQEEHDKLIANALDKVVLE